MTETPGATWSYQAGEWFGVFGARTTLLLPASERDRVAALWTRIDDGAAFGEVLDGLVAGGLSSLPGFALVGTEPDATTVLLRGPGVRAVLEGPEGTVDVDGSHAATWAERRVERASSLRVVTDAGGEAGGRHFAVVQGMARVARVDLPEVPDGAAPAAPAAPDAVAAGLAATAEESSPLDDEPDTRAQPAPLGGAVTDDPSAPPPDWAPVEAGLPPVPPPPGPPPVGPPPGVGLPADGVPSDLAGPGEPEPGAPTEALPLLDVDGSDPAGSEPDDAVDVAADVDADHEVDEAALEGADGDEHERPPGLDHDGQTQIGVDAGEFARQQPGIPGQPLAPSVTRPVARLIVSDGEEVEVDRVVLVGRAPEARRFTSTDQPLLVTVASPLQEISSTHLEVRPGSGADHGSAVVTDLGSTNGTVLVQPGLDPEDLTPGIAVQLIPGAVINLGDGVTIQVTRP